MDTYKKKLALAKEALDSGSYDKETIEYIFPELKESKDEKIRKWIIGVLATYEHDRDLRNAAVAWLEKQGEQKSFDDVAKEVTKNKETAMSFLKSCGIMNANGELADEYKIEQGEQKPAKIVKWSPQEENCICQLESLVKEQWRQAERVHNSVNIKKMSELMFFLKTLNPNKKPQGKSVLETIKEEKVDNQNCVKPADKVEPKFKVGDWVIDKQGIVHQIANVIENVTYHTYGYDLVGGGYFVDSTEGVRLWTIQDAKDGDVLVCEDFGYTSLMLFESFSNGRISLYCWYNSQTNNFHINTDVALRKDANIYPATKEQRDTLMKSISDAGYTFDFEKKELKKIYWSEEDDGFLSLLLAIFTNEHPNGIFTTDNITVFKGNFVTSKRIITWLISLRTRKQWKPSDEQIYWIKWVAHSLPDTEKANEAEAVLEELLEQLKKLK